MFFEYVARQAHSARWKVIAPRKEKIIETIKAYSEIELKIYIMPTI